MPSISTVSFTLRVEKPPNPIVFPVDALSRYGIITIASDISLESAISPIFFDSLSFAAWKPQTCSSEPVFVSTNCLVVGSNTRTSCLG